MIKKVIISFIAIVFTYVAVTNLYTNKVVIHLGIFVGNWEVPNGNDYKIIDDAIARFEKLHPNVEIEYESGILKSDYSLWLANKIVNGEEPDVFMIVDEDFNTLSSLGVLKDLTEELENDITKKLKEKGYTIEYCKVDANISQKDNDSGIKKITLKLDKKESIKTDESSKNNENTTQTIENKIVSEIQKIQKVEVKVGNNTKENSTENENSKITETDIESVKEFLISEYGVSKSCLKIN